MKFGKLKRKGFSSNSRCFPTRYLLKMAKSFIQVSKTKILPFIVIFCFFNNFLLKSQNKVSLILGRPLMSVVYDSAFNSILQFLVNFGILLPNHVISANQSFRCFFLNIYMFCSRQRQIRLLSIKKDFLSNYFSGGLQFSSPCGFREIFF